LIPGRGGAPKGRHRSIRDTSAGRDPPKFYLLTSFPAGGAPGARITEKAAPAQGGNALGGSPCPDVAEPVCPDCDREIQPAQLIVRPPWTVTDGWGSADSAAFRAIWDEALPAAEIRRLLRWAHEVSSGRLDGLPAEESRRRAIAALPESFRRELEVQSPSDVVVDVDGFIESFRREDPRFIAGLLRRVRRRVASERSSVLPLWAVRKMAAESLSALRCAGRAPPAAAFEAPLPKPASLLRSVEVKDAGPPPPRPSVAECARQPISDEGTAVVRKQRWYLERTRKYVRERAGEIGESHAKGLLWALTRFPTDTWPKAGVSPSPTNAREVTRSHVRALRECPVWTTKTRSFYLQALRGWLRWERSPLAEEKGLWRLDATPINKWWISKAQLVALWESCENDQDRLVVAALGFNGLRRIELLRLRVRDLVMEQPEPKVHLTGKGTRDRTIPASAHLYGALVVAAAGKMGPDRVYPFQRSSVDRRLAALGRRAGIPRHLSGHVLRRSFGRIAYYAEPEGMPLVDLQHVYGHKSPTMTAEYVGIDLGQMAAGIARFERWMDSED
jgi:integrase